MPLKHLLLALTHSHSQLNTKQFCIWKHNGHLIESSFHTKATLWLKILCHNRLLLCGQFCFPGKWCRFLQLRFDRYWTSWHDIKVCSPQLFRCNWLPSKTSKDVGLTIWVNCSTLSWGPGFCVDTSSLLQIIERNPIRIGGNSSR